VIPRTGERLPAVGLGSWRVFDVAADPAALGQAFLRWILAHPAVTCVIPGTRNPGHAADDLAAAQSPLPDAAMRRTIAAHWASLAG
jgi:aryl-alcohol dehydrogenase-like predicted oxidoreductase